MTRRKSRAAGLGSQSIVNATVLAVRALVSACVRCDRPHIEESRNRSRLPRDNAREIRLRPPIPCRSRGDHLGQQRRRMSLWSHPDLRARAWKQDQMRCANRLRGSSCVTLAWDRARCIRRCATHSDPYCSRGRTQRSTVQRNNLKRNESVSLVVAQHQIVSPARAGIQDAPQLPRSRRRRKPRINLTINGEVPESPGIVRARAAEMMRPRTGTKRAQRSRRWTQIAVRPGSVAPLAGAIPLDLHIVVRRAKC